jgi:hypothetical protein
VIFEPNLASKPPNFLNVGNRPFAPKTPLTVTFSDNSTGDITGYDWDFGDGGQATEANPSHVYTASGVYTVTLTVTDASGMQDTLTRPSYIFVDPMLGYLPLILSGWNDSQ